MRIGIDTRPADAKNITGIGMYVSNLVKAMADIDKKNEYFLYYSSLKRNADVMPGPQQENIKKRVIRLPYISDSGIISYLWTNVFLPGRLKKDEIDIFHSSYAYLPYCLGVKTVTTIHDLNFLICPELSSKRHKRHCQKVYNNAVKNSDVLIAVSENTKKDIQQQYGIDKGKIRVILNGIDNSFFQIRDRDKLKATAERLALPDKFILALGSAKKRKNTSGLIREYCLVKKKYHFAHKLIISGIDSLSGLCVSDVPREVKKDILTIGFVSADDLVYLYNLAALFVYPSLYEGFGFPLLEAMACGTPVVSANTSSLPELMGDAGILADPHKEGEICRGIASILGNQILRDGLSQKGLLRVKNYSWKKTAEDTLNLYETVF